MIEFIRSFSMTEESEHFKVLLPSMGEGVIEATVNKWLKNSGERVAKDEPLLEVSTDKVDTEIASTHSGIQRQLGKC
jgi:2-oxoglutarate dehydrogenase E2 component (dihydrolipoamide succinyltransferase)